VFQKKITLFSGAFGALTFGMKFQRRLPKCLEKVQKEKLLRGEKAEIGTQKKQKDSNISRMFP
jgi:hypothetical protein